MQIKTTGGNTENVNNIFPGQISEWRSYAQGNIEFTITVQGSTDTVVIVPMVNCWEYDIVIDSADQISTVPAERD